MATTSGNNVVKPGKVLEYPITQGVDFNQGDLVYSNSGIATVAASDANCQYLIGVSRLASPMDPAPYGTAVYPNYAEIEYGGVYSFKSTVGESYAHGTALYIGADAQTVTTVAGTYSIGKVYQPDGATLTGAAGVKVLARIINRSETAALLI